MRCFASPPPAASVAQGLVRFCRRHTALAVAALLASCSSLPTTRSARAERWGFTAPWDARSAVSVRASAAQLDAVVSGWIALDSLSGQPIEPFPDTVARTTVATRRMAIVTSFSGNTFHPEMIRRLALDSAALRRSASAIAVRARREGYRGLVLDFQGMTGADSGMSRHVVAAIARSARQAGVSPIVVAVPASDTVAYPARLFEGSADLLLVQLYDQHWATSPPGAIAAPDWARRVLGMRVAERGASRLVAALPLYGYLWRPNAVATTVSFDEARRLATEAATTLARDPASGTLHASRAGADGWELWVSDAELVASLEREVANLGVRRVAYWRLGLEDATMWQR